jgi:hypothetical protein
MQVEMKQRVVIILILVWMTFFLFPVPGFSQEEKEATSDDPAKTLTLGQAVICEELFSNSPRNRTVVFSAAKEKVICFTAFESVPEKTFIYHNWFHKDIPSSRLRLMLRPPRWSTYSSIQIRRTDIGPWRVEITDATGQVLRVLRFSITE